MAGETKYPLFTESLVFSRQVDATGSLDVLFAIQDDLLLDPTRGDLVMGTHGARKARIGDPSKGAGKRGGYRYIYLYLEHQGHIFLLYLYGKGKMADLSPGQKKVIRAMVDAIKEERK
jgi:hypothetical protein